MPIATGEDSMATVVRIRTLSQQEPGKVKMSVTIQSGKAEGLSFQISIFDKGSPELNREEVRGLLQEFSRELQEALQQPLWYE
jgi:hypothetical protein